MTPEQKLQSLFAEETAPTHDRVFEAAVAKRIARRRAVATVAASAPMAVAGGALLWGLQPAWAGAEKGLLLFPALSPALIAGGLAVLCALTVVRQVLRT